MTHSKRTGWKRPKKVRATRREAMERDSKEQIDLFKSDLLWRAQQRKEGTR